MVAYSGAPSGSKPFSTVLARFQAFDATQTGGVSVASAQIDGRAPGQHHCRLRRRHDRSSSHLQQRAAGRRHGTGNVRKFRTLRKRFVGRQSRRRIRRLPDRAQQHRTAPGTGAQVKVFSYSLMTRIGAAPAWPNNPGIPHMDASFAPSARSYRGPISIATGWLAGSYGGAEAIAAGQLSGAGAVKLFSTGTGTPRQPADVLAQRDGP